MSTRVRDKLTSAFDELRHEPTAKRVRAQLDGETVVDSIRAALIWEPRRVVPSYAVPAADIHGEVRPAQAGRGHDDAAVAGVPMPEVSRRPVLDPSVPFAVHTADGEAVDLQLAGRTLTGAAFRLADADLPDYVVLDFRAFDRWLEEDEPIVSHPRDPFHRIDVLPSSRHVRIELDGEVIAESSRPTLLFETMLPTRYYLPREDVRAELTPTDTHTTCAYKGEASYWSLATAGRDLPDVAWSYEAPLHEAAGVKSFVAFFNEHVDVIVDGERHDRPITPWSKGPQRGQ